MHIPDWFTFTSHRFFLENGKPLQRVVTASKSVLDCYNRLNGNSSWADYRLVTCSDGDYMIFQENGGGTVKRKIPFPYNTDYERLVRSWGFSPNELRAGMTVECSSLPGSTLTMRPGTIVEEASDTNFWIVTADEYHGNDAVLPSPSTKAVRLYRYTGGDSGNPPFMPAVFGSYDSVIQIPDYSIQSFVSDPSLSYSFTESEAIQCTGPSCNTSGGPMCGGGGGSVPDPGGQPCSDTSQRACVNGTDYKYCQEVSPGVYEWSQSWPCGVGWECTNSQGECTPTPYNCTPGSSVCYGTAYDATCEYNAATGIYDYVPSVCPAGYECVAPNTSCTEKAPDPSADPPHTIRCVDHDYTYSMFITGPVQNGLWGTVSGQEVFLEYGSNSDGWSTYVPSVGSKPSSLWVGEQDGQGNPYVHELVMKGGVDELNMFLYSPDSGQQQWFNLDWGIWTVTGDCYQSGTLIRHDSLPPPSGTITCVQEGSDMRYLIDGPVQMLLVGGTASGPIEIQYGSNSDGWSVPTSGKPTAPWNGSRHHEIVIPTSVNGLNFYVHGSGSGQWFDLVDADWDGDQWTVGGACSLSGSLIVH